jgi:hypothetical protein
MRTMGPGRAMTGACALVVAVTVFLPSAAFGATTSWRFDSSAYDFGRAPLDSFPGAPREFILTNTGETPIVMRVPGISWRAYAPAEGAPFFFSSNACSGTLEPQQSCSLSVSLDPIYPGFKEGWVHVRSKSGEPHRAEARLTGEAIGPWVSVSPEHLAFGPIEVGAISPPQIVTVRNLSGGDLAIEGVTLTNLLGALEPSSPFRVVGGSCRAGQAISVDAACTIEVVMAPSEPGAFRARVKVADDAPESPQSIELDGTGMQQSRPSHKNDRAAAPEPPTLRARITHHPARLSKRRTATFWFSAAPAGAIHECKLDRRGFKPCSAPRRFRQLSIGWHEFMVRIRVPSEESVSVPARFRWRVKAQR